MLGKFFSRLRPSASAVKNYDFENDALQHMDSLFRTARRMTRNEQDGEDLVQETYLRAFRSSHTFQPGTNMRAWLFRILHNTFLNLHRPKWSANETSLEDLEEYYIYQRANPGDSLMPASAEEEVFRELVDVDVKKAIKELPE